LKYTSNYLKHTSKNPLQRYLIGRFYSTLIEFALLATPVTILDAGCGEGFTVEKLWGECVAEKLVGIDSSMLALGLGRKLHPKLDLRYGDIYKLPYKKDSFDLVICSEVLEHLTKPQLALAEAVRVSKKHLIITVPNEPFFMLANFLRGKNISRLGNHPEHIQHWSFKRFKKFLKQQNLKVEYATTSFPWTIVLAQKGGKK